MLSSVLPPSMRIPEAVNPPIPGESHRYYGNIHLKQLKLPSNSFNHSFQGTSYPHYSVDGSIEGDLDIHEATAAGNFIRVKELLAPRGSGETTSAFLLANEASPSSGLTPLHYAASRGHLEIVRWLIDEAGAIVDLEDQTGETALLKASYNGHSSVVAYLLQKKASVIQKDNDGWTALHNASAQGYLQIVKYLIEHTSADVDVKSTKGHTPLMNAASKGNIEIVEYLLKYGHANPLIKNSFGETAYDVAAISLEVYICELLEKAERDWWKGKRAMPTSTSLKEYVDLPAPDQPYDVYSFHITVPVIVYENQRTASTLGFPLRGPPKYSANNLLKSDLRGPWSLPNGKPSSRDEVQLPLGPSSSSISVVSNITSSKSQKAWFWVTDWQIDMSHPQVDSQGWQYAKNFEESDKNWFSEQRSSSGSWVRRKRWVRIMKRRMDLTTESGSALHFAPDNNLSVVDQLGRYKEAIELLLSGIKADKNPQRKQEATCLVNSFMTHAEYLDNILRNELSSTSPSFKDVPMTPTITQPLQSLFRLESPDDRPKNVTPNAGTISNFNAPSTTSLKSFETIESPWNDTVQSNDVVGNSSSIFGDSAMVSPTRAHPQLGLTVKNVQAITVVGKWENDEDVHECRRCQKKFNMIFRRHHCRRCGQVVCDKCSTARVMLPLNQVLTDPSQSGEASQLSQYHRVCILCFESLDPKSRERSDSFTSTTIVSGSSSTSNRRRMSNSSMTVCPVCNMSLSKAPAGKNEEHIKSCLEKKNSTGVSGYQYVGEQVLYSSLEQTGKKITK
ncbi:14124_t:CDS:2 [Funneliformis caledonium]|uniref:14124_t:CDS:1 n=1 Tax=Funneliformis caledonium TaxID=1117310 RepID=A0A9N9FVB7_9GLOM|nr:14124_t:CDS:2 [Funneliformis caledonium]